jgi:hypothetical protein
MCYVALLFALCKTGKQLRVDEKVVEGPTLQEGQA